MKSPVWLQHLRSIRLFGRQGVGTRRSAEATRPCLRLRVEPLEERTVPSVLLGHTFLGLSSQSGTDYQQTLIKQTGDINIDTGLQSGSWDGGGSVPAWGSSARASADGSLHAFSSAFGTSGGLFAGVGFGQGLAAWRDVAFGGNPAQAPVLRFT